MNKKTNTNILLKVFKIIVVIIGVLFLLFGIFGLTTELSADKANTVGLVLSSFFMGIGVLLIYHGLRKPKTAPPSPAIEAKPSEALQETEKAVIKDQPDKPVKEETADSEDEPWQKKFLIISTYIEIIFTLFIMVTMAIFGYAGFKGGEMGFMVGIFAIASIIAFSAAISALIVALRGIRHSRQVKGISIYLTVG